MTEFLFPDNTVLCNFAAVDRLDLLKSVLGGRGRWTEAVAFESTRSARFLPALRQLARDPWLGDAIEVTDDVEIQKVDAIRRAVFGGTDDEPLKHLGEAQTCFVLTSWAGFAGSWWVSDDREAVRYARFRGITTRETIDLVCTAVGAGDVSSQEAFDLMYKMADLGRGLRLPASVAELLR